MALLPDGQVFETLCRLLRHLTPPSAFCLLPSVFCLLSSVFRSSSRASLLKNAKRSVSSWRTHDAAARMGRRAAHVEALYRRLVLRPAGRGAEEKELLERQFTLEDVPFGQTEVPLDVERREDL